MDDIKFPASREEQIASTAHLFEPLIQFYFRAQNKWCASGKSIIRYLKNDNTDLALEFTRSFEGLFQTGVTSGVESVVKKILAPYGGLFWDGFKSNASKEAKLLGNTAIPGNRDEADFMKIRLLTSVDWKTWKQVRLEALKNSPESFGSSFEEELRWPDSEFQDCLNKNNIFGAYVDGILAASVGFYSLKGQKTKHRGVIWGMYTKPEYREQGIASALMQAIISFAKSQVIQLHLTCVTNNLRAIQFYHRHGFKIYGTEPRALKIDDTFFDEHLMTLDLMEAPMKKLDTYLSLCTEFYDLSKPKPPEDAYTFYRSYALNAAGSILEPMCGTGQFLLPLLEEGFNVHGFDASDNMLEALLSKARDRNLHPTVWKGFIEDLKRPEKYSLIFIPSGSFCLIVDPVAIKSVIKTLYEHLSDDGILLLEGETSHAVPPLNIWRGSQYSRPDGKIIMLSSCARLDGNICSSIGKYELIHHNSIIRTEIEEYKVRIYEAPELIAILTSCGFRQVRTIKAFDRASTPSDNDESIVYECRK